MRNFELIFSSTHLLYISLPHAFLGITLYQIHILSSNWKLNHDEYLRDLSSFLTTDEVILAHFKSSRLAIDIFMDSLQTAAHLDLVNSMIYSR